MSSQLPTVVLGIASALTWGAGDFCGGMASRRSGVLSVVVVSQVIGTLALVMVARSLSDPWPTEQEIMLALVAGLVGAAGLVAFYRGLASGQMGVVAPISAVISALAPMVVGAWLEGWPAPLQVAGFALAIPSAALISRGGGKVKVHPREVGLAAFAGLCFATWLIVIDRASGESALWPLIASRGSSMALLLSMVVLGRRRLVPERASLPLVVLAGVLDSGGNGFYALAAHAGRLDIAAVLSSMYPGMTVALARVVLREHMSRGQWLGIAGALVAIAFIALPA